VRPRISTVRHHISELMAVLLAGVGLGVGAAAILDGHGGTTRHILPAAHTRAKRALGESLPEASAGVQPNRGEAKLPSESTRQVQSERTESQSAIPLLTTDAKVSFAQLSAGLPGRIELTVAPLGAGTPQTLGGDQPAHGWSTIKIPVLTALLKARGARGQGLTSDEKSWAQSAITESSNESILRLFTDLERLEGGLVGASEYVQELFRISGDEDTVVATAPPPPGAATTFGQTEWRPNSAVKFFIALARRCLLSSEATDYILGLMQHIESSESWGLGAAGIGTPVAFKGGWGPELSGAYLVRQSGIVDVGSSDGVAVAIVAFPPPGSGSFETGTAMVTQTAKWLRKHLRLVPRADVPCS
jgi:hypothetical protein